MEVQHQLSFNAFYLFILGKLVALTSPGITTARTFASPFWQPSGSVPRIGQDSSVASDPKDSHVTSRVTHQGLGRLSLEGLLQRR